MPGFPREELEEMISRWVAANDYLVQDYLLEIGPIRDGHYPPL